MCRINLTGNPFYLTREDIDWVMSTVEEMTLEEKVGQLFCFLGDAEDEQLLSQIETYRPGGIMFRKTAYKALNKVRKQIKEKVHIPLLIAANLEAGGNGILEEGTYYGNQMQVAATNHVERAYELGLVAGREGGAVGCNLAFAPVVDIDFNFRNPITNTRTYGSDVERVTRMAKAYMDGMRQAGLAVSIKHFPGDGVDDRDQHVLASVNSLSCEEWDKSYGYVYKEMIDQGARTLMVGHIMQPAYSKYFRSDIVDSEIKPATLSRELLQDLLRGQLGYNGLIITDATTMTGFNMAGKREEIVPNAIEAGCDLFLFNKYIEEDYKYMLDGVRKGILSMTRLKEAVIRILATKASLGLHKKIFKSVDHQVIGAEEHIKWAKSCANESITLVKNKEGLIPINTSDHRRVLLIPLGDNEKVSKSIRLLSQKLEEKGFCITVDKSSQLRGRDLVQPVEPFCQEYDLAIYIALYDTASNKTELKVHWHMPTGINAPWFTAMIPTLFISLGNPYHLQDVPHVKTYINAYSDSTYTIDALVDKLVGESPFMGISPVDPFCGYWDTRL